jgi:hypothetical protein
MIRSVIVLPLALSTPVVAADVEFCWVGEGGYRVAGEMSFPDALADAERIGADDVSAFRITGYRDGETVGSWSLDMVTPATSWMLNFSPRAMAFFVGGEPYETHGQEWNADGAVFNCGSPGFGLNIGNHEQDLCIDGQYVEASGIARDTPLAAYARGTGPVCIDVPQISGLVRRVPVPPV